MIDCPVDLDVYPLGADLFIAQQMGYQVTVHTVTQDGIISGIVNSITPDAVEIKTHKGTASALLRYVTIVETMVSMGFAS